MQSAFGVEHGELSKVALPGGVARFLPKSAVGGVMSAGKTVMNSGAGKAVGSAVRTGVSRAKTAAPGMGSAFKTGFAANAPKLPARFASVTGGSTGQRVAARAGVYARPAAVAGGVGLAGAGGYHMGRNR